MGRDWFTLSWQGLVIRGVIALGFGVVAMVWPEPTVTTLVVIWGVWALLDGLGTFVQAFRVGMPGAARVLLGLLGVITLAVALFAILRPALTITGLTWLLGIWLLVRAVFEVIGAFSSSRSLPRSLILALAVLDIVLGLLFVTNPGTAVLGVTFVLGLVAFAWGALFVVVGLLMRRTERDLLDAERAATGPVPPPPAP
jgi:uncharacterized membrane protein HdeD (DUF308 family)